MTPRHFAWQAWHLATSTFVSRGRLGTWRHEPPLCVAGVALMRLGQFWSPVTPRHFAWQAWRLAASTFVSRGRRGTWRHLRRGTLHGRRGTYGTGLALVARLGPFWSPVTPRHFAWQAWHLAASTFVSRGRLGTWRHPPWFCVAGVTLSDILLRFAWQEWHLVISTFVLPGRRGAWRHPLAFYVALGGIHLGFAWQAWHSPTSTFVSRGRIGTWLLPFCVAELGLGYCHLRSAWQASPGAASLSHTSFTHHLCQALSFTHNFVTHHLSHTALSHTSLSPTTLSHTSFTHHLCQTLSFTHNFVTHHLSHTIFHGTTN